MADLYLDFRRPEERRTSLAEELLQYTTGINTFRYDEPEFSLLVTLSDRVALWSPYQSPDGRMTIALAGRIALSEPEWEAAREVAGEGGLACKAIYSAFTRHREKAFGTLNGSFVLAVVDAAADVVYLVSDRCGMSPLFVYRSGQWPVYCTHQDVLAACGPSRGYDRVSLCEFLATGRVTFPFTYHADVRAAEYGSIHAVALTPIGPQPATPTRYFSRTYHADASESAEEFAIRLSSALKRSVERRSHRLLGRTALGLSGGLDSRTILCAASAPEEVYTYCLHDAENREFRTARAIAKVVGSPFLPLRRSPEYYGEAAALGVRISGGTGNLLSNHLLGSRDRLLDEGFENILNGQYCDYFFKGLAQNCVTNPFTQEAAPAPFSLDWYTLDRFQLPATEMEGVTERLEVLFPRQLRADPSEEARLEVEGRRLFPLCYEPENPEVLIPQRTLGWYMPTLDNDVLDVYFSMPARLKFDRTMYEQVVASICPPKVCAIPNSNTGVPIGASATRYFRVRTWRYALEKMHKLAKRIRPSIATTGSWPDGAHYLRSSTLLQGFWTVRNQDARDLFAGLVGFDVLGKPPADYAGKDSALLQRLLTLKIWLDGLVRRQAPAGYGAVAE